MNIFKETANNVDEYTATVNSYVDWSTSICSPSWNIGVFPSQKPWFNADICSKIRISFQVNVKASEAY